MDWAQTEIEIEEALLPVQAELYLAFWRLVEHRKRIACEVKGLVAAVSEMADAFAEFAEALEGIEDAPGATEVW